MNNSTIKNLIPLKIKQSLSTYINSRDLSLPSGKRCFIFLAADYGNIGDIAISAAQKQYLESTLANYTVISIPISQTRLVLRSIKKQIKPNDVITIIGGGNMGAIYPDIEALRQLVIKSFPKNRIVCFPQTLDWDKSLHSKRALKRIVKVYSGHPNIHIFARESITYKKLVDLFKRHNKVTVGLVPDIVMSSTAKDLGASDNEQRSSILTCLRNDKEAVLTNEQYQKLDDVLAATKYNIIKTDTHAGGSGLDDLECSKLLKDKLNQFRSAHLVITDRLHGMIMCILAGTPCLVLPNSNHKISQTWLDWLQNESRLIFVQQDNFENTPLYINQLLNQSHGSIYQSPVDIENYDPLKKALTET